MTAHDIFRQPEPKLTLIFCAGATNPNLSPLNQGYDLLVGVDGGAQTLITAGFAPDWAIGDFDSVPPPDCENLLILPPEKDDSDLEAALSHILPQYHIDKIEKIIILGALGAGRLDHLLANIWLAHQPRFAAYLEKFYFIEQENSLRFYHSGSHRIRREHDKKYLSFFGLTALRGLSLHQVKYELPPHDYLHPIALISNKFLADNMSFDLQEGILAVIQSIDKIN